MEESNVRHEKRPTCDGDCAQSRLNPTDYRRRIDNVVDHVAADLARSYSVDELAGVAHFSKFHFHRVFKAIAGESVAQMVNRLRLEAAAATLIYHPDRVVTAVALDHGFSSGANFTKAFTRRFGHSPKQYRTSRMRTPENSKIGKAKARSDWDDLTMNAEVQIVDQPKVRLAYLRRQGAYDHHAISRMYSTLETWVEQRGCAASHPMSVGITWSDSHIVTEEHWRYDACVAVGAEAQPDRDIGIRNLRGGATAQLGVSLGPAQPRDLSHYWDWLLGYWLVRSGRELADAPSYEIYDEPERSEQFCVRLCLPLAATSRARLRARRRTN